MAGRHAVSTSREEGSTRTGRVVVGSRSGQSGTVDAALIEVARANCRPEASKKRYTAATVCYQNQDSPAGGRRSGGEERIWSEEAPKVAKSCHSDQNCAPQMGRLAVAVAEVYGPAQCQLRGRVKPCESWSFDLQFHDRPG